MGRARLAAVLLALAAAGTGAWVLMRPGDGDAIVAPEDRTVAEAAAEPGESGRLESRPARAIRAQDGAEGERIVPKSSTDAAAPPIRVQVVDAAGQPIAGVRALLVKDRGRGQDSVASAPTDSAGLTVVSLANWPYSADLPAKRWFVTVAVPMTAPPKVELDPEKPPADPVRIAVGASGRVRVRIVDHDRAPMLDKATVLLSAGTKDSWASAISFPPECARPTDEGSVVFEPVGVGTYVVATAEIAGRRYPSMARGDGPRTAGEETTLEVIFKARPSFVTGRVLSPVGKPLVDATLKGLVTVSGMTYAAQAQIRTDASGRFRLEIVEPVPPGGTRTAEIRLESRPDWIEAGAVLDLSGELPAGDKDVGDVRLVAKPPPPLIAAGTVVDEGGKPLAGARLTVEKKTAGEPDGTWTPVPGLGLSLPSDEDGRFEVFGACSAELRLSAWRAGYWGENPTRFEAGARGLVVKLNRAASLEGSVILPPGTAAEDVRVSIRLEGQDQDWKAWGSSAWIPAESDGSFFFDSLRGGLFTLSVTLTKEHEFPAAEVRGIDLVPGQRCRDPRAQKIDLGWVNRAVIITVVDAKGDRIVGATAAELSDWPSGSRARSAVVFGREGTIKLPLKKRPTDVMVGAMGFRRTLVSGVDSDRRVVLEQGPQVRVILSGLPSEAPKSTWFDVYLEPEGVQTTNPAARVEEFVGRTAASSVAWPHHELAFRASEPGRHVMRVSAHNGAKRQDLDERVVIVPSGGAEQVLEVALDPEVAAKAFKNLEERNE